MAESPYRRIAGSGSPDHFDRGQSLISSLDDVVGNFIAPRTRHRGHVESHAENYHFPGDHVSRSYSSAKNHYHQKHGTTPPSRQILMEESGHQRSWRRPNQPRRSQGDWRRGVQDWARGVLSGWPIPPRIPPSRTRPRLPSRRRPRRRRTGPRISSTSRL